MLALVLLGSTVEAWIDVRLVFVGLLLPVALAARLGGWGAGLLATAVAAVGATLFYFAPLASFQIERLSDGVLWMVFIIVGVLISLMTEMRARDRRETEAPGGAAGLERAQIKVRAGFSIGLAVTAAIGLATFVSGARLREHMERVGQTYEVIATLRELTALMTSAQNAQRGFTITGEARYLSEHETAARQLQATVARLRLLTGGHAARQADLDRMEPMLRQRLEASSAVLALRQRQGIEALSGSLPTAAGWTLQNEITGLLQQMERAERALLAQRKALADKTAETANAVTAVGGAVLFAFVAVLLAAIGRDFAGSRRARAELQAAQANLESRVAERTAELVRAYRVHHENEANLAAIVAGATDGIITFDAEGRIESANPAAQAIFGGSCATLRACGLAALIPEGLTPAARWWEDGHAPGGPRTARGRRRDGREFPLEIAVVPMSVDGVRTFAAFVRDITERERAEAEVAGRLQLEAQLSNLAAAVPGAIYTLKTWPDGRVALPYVSAGWEELTGLTPEQVRVDATAALQAIHPDDQAGYRAAEAEAAKTMTIFLAEFRIAHPRRGWIWLEARSMPERMADGAIAWHGHTVEITARKRTEAAWRESEERLRLASDAASIGVWDNHLDSGRLVWSEQMERMMGYAPGTFSGRLEAFLALIHPEDRVRHQLARVRAMTGDGFYTTELRFCLRDGRVRWGLLRGRLWRDAQGRPERLLGIDIDISDRKRSEEEVSQLNATLERRVAQRTAELEAANREMEAFAYSVSHDLRTPLRGIDGFATALLEDNADQLSAEARRKVDTIRAETKRMGTLIHDLLAFSQLGRTALHRQAVDMTGLARSTAAALRALEPDRAVELEVAALPECQGDPALLKQVWVNLLSNALKYSRRRPVARIEVGGRQEADGAVYFVRDNGTGFDMRYAGKLFGVFQRLHRAADFEGTGVGLAIVQRIVERHGGKVWAEAAVEAGATFSFKLPIPEPS